MTAQTSIKFIGPINRTQFFNKRLSIFLVVGANFNELGTMIHLLLEFDSFNICGCSVVSSCDWVIVLFDENLSVTRNLSPIKNSGYAPAMF